MSGQVVHGNRMARFVNGRLLQILPGLDPALLGRSCGDLHQRFVQILHRQHRAILPGCQDGRLIEQIAQICTGEACSGTGHGFQIYRGIQPLALGVDLQDFFPPLHIRTAHMNLPVKPSRTQQRRVQNIRPVRRSQNDHTLRPTEAVHFHQQLVQGLLFFIMAAAQAGATLAAHSINFIDENDSRCYFLRLIE